MSKLRPLHDRILVKRIDEKQAVKGGIIIPDTAKEKPQEGESSPSEPASSTITASGSRST